MKVGGEEGGGVSGGLRAGTSLRCGAADPHHHPPPISLPPPPPLPLLQRHAATISINSPLPGRMVPITILVPILHTIHAIRRLVEGASTPPPSLPTLAWLASAPAARSCIVLNAASVVAAHPACAFLLLAAVASAIA